MTRPHALAVFLAGLFIFVIAGLGILKAEWPNNAAPNAVTTNATTPSTHTGVQIVSPKAGGTWVPGQTYTVSWTGANLPHKLVTIGIPYDAAFNVSGIYPIGQGYLDAGQATATIDRCFPWHYNNSNTLGVYAGDSNTVRTESSANPIALTPLYVAFPTNAPYIVSVNTEPFPNDSTFEVDGSGFASSTTAYITGNGVTTTLMQVHENNNFDPSTIYFDPGNIPVDGGSYDIYVSNGSIKSNTVNTQDGCG